MLVASITPELEVNKNAIDTNWELEIACLQAVQRASKSLQSICQIPHALDRTKVFETSGDGERELLADPGMPTDLLDRSHRSFAALNQLKWLVV